MADAAPECPGHEWQVQGVHLAATGGALWVACLWCGELVFQPGQNYREHLLE